MVETAIALSLVGVAGFLVYIGYRLKESSRSTEDDNTRIISRIAEIISYCLAGLILDALLFIMFEATNALSYSNVVRTVFLIFQIILGLVAGLGMIVFVVLLFIMLFGYLFGGKNK